MSQAAGKAEKHDSKPVPDQGLSFQWEDPLDLEASSRKKNAWCATPRAAYAQDKLLPRVLEAYRKENSDPAMIREMGELGLLGPTIPEKYGGAGLGYVATG